MSCVLLINANALSIPLADCSVQMAATSPPYYGLRDYGVDGQIGLEQTPEMYVANLVAVFREVRRVLRDDGVLFLNLGDSYCGNPHYTGNKGRHDNADSYNGGFEDGYSRKVSVDGLKSKDLIGIPWRVAFALQADGWYLRSDIIWSKPNPMPESVRDRPTKAHEYVFLLTKSSRYYWDADAVREEYAPASLPRALRGLSENNKWTNGAPGSTAHTMSQARPNMRKQFEQEHGGGGNGFKGHSGYVDANGRLLVNPAGRNMRTVWNIATAPYKGAHFATWPPKLVEPMVKAGSSEKGCCPVCGKAWVRVIDNPKVPDELRNRSQDTKMSFKPTQVGSGQKLQDWRNEHPAQTIGWRPSCECHGKLVEKKTWVDFGGGRSYKDVIVYEGDPPEPVPCIVLDPFAGSGTTLMVARALGRHAVGLDLSYPYLHDQARKRLELDKMAAWTA